MVTMTEVEAPGDVELVAAFRGGDDRAATEIVRRHGQALARYVRSVGARPDDVDDVVQEAFFRAFRRLDSWRGESSLRGWLCTIGANLVRDDFRRRRGRQVLPIEDRDVPDLADPLEEATATETEARLMRGLEGLPRLQREVFLLRAQQACDYAEIARVLGTTPGAARVHYHHAVRRLKELVS